MAIANLHEVIQSSILRKNQLNLEITELQNQKSLAIYSQADSHSLLASGKKLLKDQYKEIYKNSPELQEQYKDYTEIPDFEEEIDRITAEYQDKLDELTSWEQAIDAQITTNSAELEELKAYTESFKGMLSTNISEDFKFGLNG